MPMTWWFALACMMGAATAEYDPFTDPFCVDGHQIPQLFIIGAEKCGTTSLSAMLHRQYRLSPYSFFDDGLGFQDVFKEPHFFSDKRRVALGLSHYANTFPACGRHVLTYDATPFTNSVLDPSEILQNIARLYGPERVNKTTFSMLLCEPVARAQDAYYFFAGWHACKKAPYFCPANQTTYPRVHAGRYDHHSDFPFTAFIDGFASGGKRLNLQTESTPSKCPASDPSCVVRLGKYDDDVVAALTHLNHLAIIPSTFFYVNADLTIAALLDLVERRSGKTPPETPASRHTAIAIEDKPLGRRTVQKPVLAHDLSPSGLVWLNQVYGPSNAALYTKIRQPPPGFVTIPPLRLWEHYNLTTFLDPPNIALPKMAPPNIEPCSTPSGDVDDAAVAGHSHETDAPQQSRRMSGGQAEHEQLAFALQP